MSGVKYDQGKIRAALVLGDFSLALTEVCKVGTFGANKYEPGGWLKVENAQERYEDALLRHWLQARGANIADPESNCLHLAHAAWNALAILELELRRSQVSTDNIDQL